MIVFILDAQKRRVPYRVESVNPGRFDVVNCWNNERYAVDCVARTCTCGNYEFVQSDTGAYCKHLKAMKEMR